MHTIRIRILGSLLLIFSLSMGVALFGIWKYQQGILLADTQKDAELIGQAIETSLQFAMLHNDHQAIQSNLETLSDDVMLKKIAIVNKDGVVAKSSDRGEIGQHLSINSSATCQACHLSENPESGVTGTLIEDTIYDNGGDPYLRTVIPIANHPLCHGCHPPTGKHCGLGILVVDYSLHGAYEMLRTVATRTILTGCLTFLVIVIFISWLVFRFIARPVDAFMEGIRQLETGNFNTWIDVQTKGEFAEMADSFNVMSRALGRYISEISNKNHEIGLLFTIVEKMSGTIEWRKIKGVLVNLLFEILDVEGVLLVLPVENDPNHVEIVIKNRGDRRQYRYIYALDANEAPHECLPKERLLSWLREELTEPFFCDNSNKSLVPLRLRNMNLGLICLTKPQGSTFTPSEKKIIPEITHHIAVSFGNARLFHLATTDGLTGLYTKRHFETVLTDLSAEFRLTGESFCLLMMDLDHFKQVNDTYGHPAGDQVLQELAILIKDNLRHHQDIACRYGGEEFVILLPNSDLQYAVQVAERLRLAVADHIFDLGELGTLQKTISIGIANCPLHAVGGKELIKAADTALYFAKDSGRNLVHYQKVD